MQVLDQLRDCARLRVHKLIFNFKERPRSAVEQLCLAESPRPRMTVEEQLERIRRHQQACLREKKKGLNVLSASDPSPSQSPSDVRDSPFRVAQVHSCNCDFIASDCFRYIFSPCLLRRLAYLICCNEAARVGPLAMGIVTG